MSTLAPRGTCRPNWAHSHHPALPLAAPAAPPPPPYTQLEKVMRALQLRRLLLYPRFHEEVDASLGADPAEVRPRGGG